MRGIESSRHVVSVTSQLSPARFSAIQLRSGRYQSSSPYPWSRAIDGRVCTPLLHRRRLRTWLACCYLLGVSSALAQEIRSQLKTSVDATRVTVGDIVTVKLSVKHPADVRIAFPPIAATLGEWTVRGSKPLVSTQLEGGSVEDTLELRLAAYKTGDFEVPAFSIE